MTSLNKYHPVLSSFAGGVGGCIATIETVADNNYNSVFLKNYIDVIVKEAGLLSSVAPALLGGIGAGFWAYQERRPGDEIGAKALTGFFASGLGGIASRYMTNLVSVILLEAPFIEALPIVAPALGLVVGAAAAFLVVNAVYAVGDFFFSVTLDRDDYRSALL